MTRWAETGRVPPASGVIVNAAALPAGFRTVKTELITVVVTIAVPTIWEAPVARPATVYSRSEPFSVRINCPASSTLTKNGSQLTKTTSEKTETNTYNAVNQLVGFTDGETTAKKKRAEMELSFCRICAVLLRRLRVFTLQVKGVIHRAGTLAQIKHCRQSTGDIVLCPLYGFRKRETFGKVGGDRTG